MTDRIKGIGAVEFEHGFGATGNKPFVVMRVYGEKGSVIGLDQLPLEAARSILNGLVTVIGRAEYEGDLHDGLAATGLTDKDIAPFMHVARTGERRRMEGDGDG